MSFGHCGIDWVHSLLDCNRSILILPELSFFRYWKILGCDDVNTPEDMLTLWKNHFNKEERQAPDTKMFYSINEEKIFFSSLKDCFINNGIERKKVFYGIHQAYIEAKKLNIDNIKVLVSHEHVSFPFKQILNEFNDASFLFIIRDPRASIAGYFKGISRKVGSLPDYHDYFIDMSIEEWLNTSDIYTKYFQRLGNKIKIIKNENLIKNLKEEMESLADWMQIEFSNNLLIRNYSDGSTPKFDSSYLDRTIQPEKDYYSFKNIKKRWLGELSDKREILMIETLFRKIMKIFEYDFIYNDNFFNKIRGGFYFLIPHRGPKRLGYYKAEENEYKRYYNRLMILKKTFRASIYKYSPQKIKSLIIWLSSFVNHVRIYFFPGNRWERYDHPLINFTYRDYNG